MRKELVFLTTCMVIAGMLVWGMRAYSALSLTDLPNESAYPAAKPIINSNNAVIEDAFNNLVATNLGLTAAHVFVGSAQGKAVDTAVTGDVTCVTNGAFTITAGAVTSGKILDGTITNGDIAVSGITGDRLQNGTVSNVQLAADSVTTAKIADGTITNGDIAVSGITGDRLQNGTVSNAQLAAASVTNATLSANAVTTGKILDGTITNADIAVSGISGDKLQDGTITNTQIAAQGIRFANLNVEVGITTDQYFLVAAGTTNVLCVTNGVVKSIYAKP